MVHCYHRHSNCWMPVLRGYIVIIIIFIHHPRRNHSQLPAQHSPHYSLRLLLSCCLLQSYLHLDLFLWRHFVWLLTAECELTLSLACLFLVCYTAVFSVVTQERCVTTLKTAV